MAPPAGAKRWYKRKWLATAGTIVLVLVLKSLFEITPWGQYMEDRAYELLLARFVAEGTKDSPGVLIVDISPVKPLSWERNGVKGLPATPRQPIQDLIEVLSDPALPTHPKAIGVDIDFSPDNGELIHPDDLKFFEWCFNRANDTKVPIVLGVKRAALRSEEWLSNPKYHRLAGYIGVRTSDRWHDHWSDRATHWIWAGNGDPMRSMSAALAGLPLNQLMIESKRWMTQPTSIIDFAPLRRIEEDDIVHVDYTPSRDIPPDGTPASSSGIHKDEFRAQIRDRISKRIVLLGDAPEEVCDSERDPDCFKVTGVSGSIHGVYLHACTAIAITGNKQINQLTLLGRLAIDSVLALFVILAVKGSIWLRRLFRFPVGRFEEIWKDFIFTVFALAIVLIAAVWWASRSKLLWTDFIIVCLVLFLQFIIDGAGQVYETLRSGGKTD
jgi:hypothetical protein